MTASATSASTPTWPRMARCAGMLTLTAASAIYIPHATGSSFAPTEVVQGTPLVLQGSSTRYRAIFKVYDMALYLPRKVQTVEEALRPGRHPVSSPAGFTWCRPGAVLHSRTEEQCHAQANAALHPH